MASIIKRRRNDERRRGYVVNTLYSTENTIYYRYVSNHNKVTSHYPDPKTKTFVESETLNVPV